MTLVDHGVTGRSDDTPTLIDEESGRPAPGEPAVGATVGRYEILGRVGSGAMGAVFAAHDPMLARRIALKVLHPRRRSELARKRLLREAQALARIGHPNVVTINDVGTDGSLLYLAMELIEGQSLAQWLDGSPREWSEVFELLLQAGRGLAAVHDAELVHRDFKPENVMVTEGRALVADFGIAQSKDDDDWAGSSSSSDHNLEISDRLTRTGTMLGTPRYMAPEQFLSEPVDARTDQFSFCIVLWESLYGRHPFAADSLASLTMSVTMGELEAPPPGHRLPPRLERVLRRGLSTRPDERYGSMNELLGALQSAVAPRRYGLILGVAATLVLGGVAAAALLPTSEATSCDGRASMAPTWSADEARTLQEAFEATGIPMAEANGQQAVRRLDAYADRWVEAHTAQCQERRQADAETQVLLDRRIACLSQRRSALSAVVEVLQHPDPTIVEHAASAVQGLDELAMCTDDERLADAAQRKVDPQIVGRVEELSHELGRARALQSAGAEERGLKLLDGIEARVLATDYPPLHADMWFIRGSLLGHRGDNAEGREFVARAFDIATAEGMDGLAADSALRLISIELALGSKADVTRRWARHADAAIARLGRPPRLQVTYLEFLSFVLGHEGNRQQGDRLLHEALELVEREMPDDSIAASNVHNALGRAAAHAGDHDAAIEHFQHAHRRLAAELGQSHPDVVGILSSIQDVYRAQGRFDRAHELDELLFPLLVTAYGPEHPEVVSTLVRRGTLLAAEGFSEDALEYYTRGLEITEKRYGPEHPVGGTILSNRAIVLSSMGRHQAAVADQRRVLRIAEASFPPHHPRVGVALDNLGSALVGAGRASEAIPLHRRSLPIWSRHGESSPSLAISLTDHGLALLEHGVPADAVPLLERAVRIFESRTLDPAELARARFVLARALAASGGDEVRAQTMAAASREIYVEAGPGRREDVEAIDRWSQTLHAPADP